jgi:hypothetical protein
MNTVELFNKTKEFVDDFMVNFYFANLNFYEGSLQSKIKDLRFKMNEAFHCKGLRNESEVEQFKKELKETEKDLFYSVAVNMNEIRKTSVNGVICVSHPSLTIGNDEFSKYLFESDLEDKKLLSFLDK